MIEVTALVFEIFLDSEALALEHVEKSMLPPKFSWRCGPGARRARANRRVRTRCMIVAPTWLLDVVADDRQARLLEARCQ